MVEHLHGHASNDATTGWGWLDAELGWACDGHRVGGVVVVLGRVVGAEAEGLVEDERLGLAAAQGAGFGVGWLYLYRLAAGAS